jgi:hypothetical protein
MTQLNLINQKTEIYLYRNRIDKASSNRTFDMKLFKGLLRLKYSSSNSFKWYNQLNYLNLFTILLDKITSLK